MIPVGPATRIFLAAGPTDMRKSFEGLSDLVRSRLNSDPLSGHLFVFANRRKTRLKLLYFDGSGTWVCANTNAPQCSHWFSKDSLPLLPALREGDRGVRRCRRRTGLGVRAIAQPYDARGSRVDV